MSKRGAALPALLGLTVVAEFLEWIAVDRLGKKHGGTRRTFWGALVGGLVGAIFGVPVPVTGSLLGVFAGTMISRLRSSYP